MRILNPYLTFQGNCEEAFTFYKSVFGGEFSYVGRFSDMPPQEEVTITESDSNKIMHISLPISKETILMGSDEYNSSAEIGNNIALSVTTDTKEDADRIFEQLSAEGRVNMPMNQTFWGDYFGMCTDRFNINWMVSYNETWAAEHSDTNFTLESQTTAV